MLLNILIILLEERKQQEESYSRRIECGFNPFLKSKEFFSQFFMITTVFVIFDIELVIIFPLPVVEYKFVFFLIISAIIFLLLRLMIEILNGLIY